MADSRRTWTRALPAAATAAVSVAAAALLVSLASTRSHAPAHSHSHDSRADAASDDDGDGDGSGSDASDSDYPLASSPGGSSRRDAHRALQRTIRRQKSISDRARRMSASSKSQQSKKKKRPLPHTPSTKSQKLWEDRVTALVSRPSTSSSSPGGRILASLGGLFGWVRKSSSADGADRDANNDDDDAASDAGSDDADDAEKKKKEKEKEEEKHGFRRIVEYWNNQIGTWEERKDDPAAKDEEKIRFVVHTRHRVVRGEETKDVYVKIKSKPLAEVLRECLPDNEQINDAVPFLEVKDVFLERDKIASVVQRLEREVKEKEEEEEAAKSEAANGKVEGGGEKVEKGKKEDKGTEKEKDKEKEKGKEAQKDKEKVMPESVTVTDPKHSNVATTSKSDATASSAAAAGSSSSAVATTTTTPATADTAASPDTDTERPTAKHLQTRLTDTQTFYTFLTAELAPVSAKLSLLLQHQTISYQLLWYIFPKGEPVWAMDPVTGQPQAGRVEYSEYIWGGPNPHFGVDVVTVEYGGGNKFSRPTRTFAVGTFGGLRKISSLAIAPLKFCPPKFEKELVERGKKWVQLYGGRVLPAIVKQHPDGRVEEPKQAVANETVSATADADVNAGKGEAKSEVKVNGHAAGPDSDAEDTSADGVGTGAAKAGETAATLTPQYREYDGPVIYRQGFGDRMRVLKYTGTGRAMVDLTSFARMNPSYDLAADDPYGEDAGSTEGGVPEPDLFMCPPSVYGFSMGCKKWGQLLVSNFKECKFDDKAYDYLVLGEDIKKMISGLVQNGTRVGGEDVITGKGQGIIFLLHGNPGMGKTLTAEAIAELLHKPLYAVSVGELGSNPETLEEKLSEVLQVANAWGAVLLLDEADIFLERRSAMDVHRNALVGIFLRLLEYHQGILFLTTNRVRTFDPAFASRINVALKYRDLDESARALIWRRCLIQGAQTNDNRDTTTTAFTPQVIARLSEKTLNGRQIRSIVRTARSIAASEGVEMDMKHIKVVLEVAEKFTKDLESDEASLIYGAEGEELGSARHLYR